MPTNTLATATALARGVLELDASHKAIYRIARALLALRQAIADDAMGRDCEQVARINRRAAELFAEEKDD